MSAQVTITQLPTAGAITGTELVPIVQNGQTVKTTTAALAGSPVQTQTFITKNQEPTLNNSRALSNGTGVGLVDGGPQSTLQITLNAASGSLEAASNGMIAKTASNAVVARTMTSSTAGLSITNGDGVAGAPVFALTGVALAVAGATGLGALALTSPTTVSTRQILGTAGQINVTDGNFVNSPVIGIASDAVLPGTGGVVVPVGTTGQRGSSTLGNIRFNSSTGLFEGFNGAWTSFASGSGVTSVATGTGLTGGPITSTGTISIADTAVTAGSYTLANITVNAQGQITAAANGVAGGVTSFSAGTTGLTPNTATSGAITLAGTLAIGNGGSGQTTAQAAMNAFAGAVTSGSYLRGNGTNVVMNTIQVADVPTLNQNTTGTASNVTGTVAIANGGTGQTSASAAFNALSPITTTGDLILGNGTNSATRLGIGSNGFILTVVGGTAAWQAAPTGGVTTFSAGTTGLTPNTATGGAITLAGTLAVANGGTGVTTSSGASSVVLRDANQNITVNAVDDAYTNVAATGTTTTLTVASARRYTVTGSGGQTFKLPDATTLANGTVFQFDNNQSSGAITVNNNSNTLVVSVPSGGFVLVNLLSNAISAGSWDRHDQAPSNVSWSTNTFDYPGSITSATWNGVAIAINRGGTNGTATPTAGGAAYGTGTAYAFTAAGTAGQVLTSAGASAPVWSGISGGTF
jgi:hypothetical protein